ncbi:MAG: MFS transporter [Acidibrevibacterium sp.]|uniref:MFS transporter n=1 Tax=Acidibrevibacterium sp. TaxID=2606776 RepID=UPI003D092A8F
MTVLDKNPLSSPFDALSEAPWRRFHTVAVLLFGVGWAMDAFEVTLIGNVMGALGARFHLGGQAMSVLLAAWFCGLMLGAAWFGALSDRYGRRRVFLVSLALYGLATLAAAAAPNLAVLLVLRALAGLGVGAEYAAINAAITELVPRRARGRASAIVLNFWPLGSLFAALLAWPLLAALPPDLGWRVVFAAGGLIALSTAWLRRYLPESPRWLLAQGRGAEAAAILARVTGEAPGRFALPAAPAAKASLITLLRQAPGRLALGAALDFAEAAGYYGLFAFLPLVVLPALHLAPHALPLFYLAGSFGALAGGLAAALTLDRFGRFWSVSLFYGATGLATIALALASGLGAGVIMAGFALTNLLATASWIAAYPTFSELFPTYLRATGIGASVAVGRIGAMIAPFLVAAFGAHSMAAALFLLAGFWLFGALVMVVWRIAGGVEGSGLALERIAPAAPASAMTSGASRA